MKRLLILVAILCFSPLGLSSQTSLRLYVESGIHHSARAVAFSPDGTVIATGSLDRTIKIWDVRTSRELLTLPNGKMSTTLVFHPVDPIVVGSNEDGTLTVWNYKEEALVATLRCGYRSPSIALTRDTLLCADDKENLIKRWDASRFEPKEPRTVPASISLRDWQLTSDGTLAVGDDDKGQPHIWDVGTLQIVGELPGLSPTSRVVSAAYSPRLQKLAIVDEGTGLRIWRWGRSALSPVEDRTLPKLIIHSLAFSPDEGLLAYASEDGDIVVLNSSTLEVAGRLKSRSNRIENAGFDDDSTRLRVQVWYDSRFAFDLRKGAGVYAADRTPATLASSWRDSTAINDVHLSVRKNGENGDYLQLATIEDNLSEAPLGTLVLLDKERTWIAVAPDGRFDTNVDLTDMRGAHWIELNKAFGPLSLDLFMRDYYEPKLIPRLLSCRGETRKDPDACSKQFRTISPLANLNRVRPTVKIVGAHEGASKDEVLVDVEVTGTAYDLRLFRDGQLVGQWPDEIPGVDPSDRARWRRASLIPKGAHTFPVKLSTTHGNRPVVFTAYAFNDDRVKSDTDKRRYDPPADIPKRKARAYVITIGVNKYENRSPLNFAVKDAQDMASALAGLQGYEVVSISLISDTPVTGQQAHLATKATIRAVLQRLARPSADGLLSAVVGADRLAKATPDDLVILSFSGHGHTEPNGSFYLLPSDAGRKDTNAPEPLNTFISSDELSEWLHDVDAGQLAMIIDACHSSASIDPGGFKPGPMGDRGLGQLAYDKGMRILAASQADDVALEVARLQHGLLTYALVEDGLRRGPDGKAAADVNGTGTLTLEEWLAYGEQRVPGLYDDVKSGRLKLVARDDTVSPEFVTRVVTRAQMPALFDFHRSTDDVVLTLQPAAR